MSEAATGAASVTCLDGNCSSDAGQYVYVAVRVGLDIVLSTVPLNLLELWVNRNAPLDNYLSSNTEQVVDISRLP